MGVLLASAVPSQRDIVRNGQVTVILRICAEKSGDDEHTDMHIVLGGASRYSTLESKTGHQKMAKFNVLARIRRTTGAVSPQRDMCAILNKRSGCIYVQKGQELASTPPHCVNLTA